MQISETVKKIKPSATIAAAAEAKQLKSTGVKVFEFTLGEPDFVTPDHICEAARAAMQSGKTHYTPVPGIPQLRQAIVDAYERDHGLKYTPEQVVCSNGAKHSIHNVLTAICNEGDEVIIPTPYWVSYSDLVEIAGGVPVLVETTEESGFCLSAEQFEAAITDKTRLLMLNNPCNPTGAAYPIEQLEAIARVAVKHQIPVLSDEIYEKLIYEGSSFRSFATFGEDVKDLTIIVNGVSKAYAMTGWRMGWTLAPLDISKAMSKLQSQETSCPSSITQYATVAALNGPQECVTDMLREFAKRREYVLGRLRALPGVTFAEPGGAFLRLFQRECLLWKTSGWRSCRQ
ncbi:MAG: pyridoxal phosphate-dependent aminotransferase [Planctomycetaceae bacterium]